ncbi:MAG TPA: alpha/beta fold hydrolase [Candidatus Dormibacteraeota bacterium]
MESRTGFATVNGGRLHYEIAGTGPDVVLIHSAITDSRSWGPQFKQFAGLFRVLRYDLRGFGQSDVPHGQYSNVEDLRGVMDAAGIERAAMVGVSMGGGTALDFTLEFPDRVMALALVASAVSGRSPSAEMQAKWKELEARYEADGIDALVEGQLELWLYGKGRTAAEVDPDVREAVSLMVRHAIERYPDDAQPRKPERPAVERLGEVSVPTLVIVGDRDVDHTQEAARKLAAEIPGASLAIMKDVAHVPNMEKPEEFNRLVLGFLRTATTAS